HKAGQTIIILFWKGLAVGQHIPPTCSVRLCPVRLRRDFEKQFITAAQNLFGSGWVYWVYDKKACAFDIISYSNAGCPLTNYEYTPLLCVDVWEHAYYIDYENKRPEYLSKYFDVVDWHWAERHWKRATGQAYYEMKFW
ncbi:putative superoxide dismutase, partial [Leishmania braziliensis MHOM/BR/75/M2904]